MDRRRLLSLAALAAALPAAAQASGGGEKTEKKKGGGLSYLQLPTLTATIMRVDGRRGVLTVETGIDIPDVALRARAELLAPGSGRASSRPCRSTPRAWRPPPPPTPSSSRTNCSAKPTVCWAAPAASCCWAPSW
uniref:Tat pathway signal protein n=1 Tax=Phenylobacterium glaciei TaxID=2803784 RepID=A0A974P432_9CAUL|nr:Tat pathway signal protein [Phenylobacterium glaciei]